jgi:hypothetical protein
MALTLNVNWHGLNVNNVYVKVLSVNGDKKTMTATVGYFGPENEDSIRGMLYSNTFGFKYTIDGSSPINQAYEHLKTLPEFEGAVGC